MVETTAPVAYDRLMAERYDEDFEASFGGADRGDIGFFRSLAAATSGAICEVGTGTGRVIMALAETVSADRVLLGVEPSQPMRWRCEDKIAADPALAARVSVRPGSFEAIPLPDAAAGFVYAAFRSFQHVLTPEAQLRALVELQRVLVPGGLLALDLFDPSYGLLADAGPGRGLRYRTARGTTVERWESRHVRRVDQIIEVTFRWIERYRGKIVKDLSESYDVRYTFPHELRHLLARAGLADAVIHGGYDCRPIGEEPRELIVVAKKPWRADAA